MLVSTEPTLGYLEHRFPAFVVPLHWTLSSAELDGGDDAVEDARRRPRAGLAFPATTGTWLAEALRDDFVGRGDGRLEIDSSACGTAESE